MRAEKQVASIDRPLARPPWTVEVGARVRKGFVRSTASTAVLTGLFFIAYFYLQRHPAYVPTVMPLTVLDLIIPFQPLAIIAYVSLWIYLGAGPGLQRTTRDFLSYGAWLISLCATGLGIFYFRPTRIPTPVLTDTGFLGFDMLRRVDATSNACPSMHVAAAIFTAIRVDEVFRSTRSPPWLRVLNGAWFGSIAYSTLAIKQHVVLDVVAGALLGGLFALLSLRWRPIVAVDAPGAPLALAQQAD